MSILLASLIAQVAAEAGGRPAPRSSRWAGSMPGPFPRRRGSSRAGGIPGIFWVHNDSGNAPLLFAVRSDGRIVRRFRLAIPNLDWEDIAIDDQGHLYLGDIGNNTGLLRVRTIYRLDEPDPSSPEDKDRTARWPPRGPCPICCPRRTGSTPRAWSTTVGPRSWSPSTSTAARPSCSPCRSIRRRPVRRRCPSGRSAGCRASPSPPRAPT